MQALVASNAFEGVLSSHMRNTLVLSTVQLGILYHIAKRPRARAVGVQVVAALGSINLAYGLLVGRAHLRRHARLGPQGGGPALGLLTLWALVLAVFACTAVAMLRIPGKTL